MLKINVNGVNKSRSFPHSINVYNVYKCLLVFFYNTKHNFVSPRICSHRITNNCDNPKALEL